MMLDRLLKSTPDGKLTEPCSNPGYSVHKVN